MRHPAVDESAPLRARIDYWSAGMVAFIGFAMFGFFTSLAPSFLTGTLHETSHDVAGIGFRAAVATVIAIAPVRSRGEALAGLFLIAYLGLSLPVLLLEVAPTDPAMIAFGALMLGLLAAAAVLLRRGARRRQSRPRARVGNVWRAACRRRVTTSTSISSPALTTTRPNDVILAFLTSDGSRSTRRT